MWTTSNRFSPFARLIAEPQGWRGQRGARISLGLAEQQAEGAVEMNTWSDGLFGSRMFGSAATLGFRLRDLDKQHFRNDHDWNQKGVYKRHNAMGAH